MFLTLFYINISVRAKQMTGFYIKSAQSTFVETNGSSLII